MSKDLESCLTYRHSENTSWFNDVNSASHAIPFAKLFKTQRILRRFSKMLKVWSNKKYQHFRRAFDVNNLYLIMCTFRDF